MIWEDAIDLTFEWPKPTSLLRIVGEDGALLVDIKPDGSIEYGTEYDPDEAARVFWQALASLSMGSNGGTVIEI